MCFIYDYSCLPSYLGNPEIPGDFCRGGGKSSSYITTVFTFVQNIVIRYMALRSFKVTPHPAILCT